MIVQLGHSSEVTRLPLDPQQALSHSMQSGFPTRVLCALLWLYDGSSFLQGNPLAVDGMESRSNKFLQTCMRHLQRLYPMICPPCPYLNPALHAHFSGLGLMSTLSAGSTYLNRFQLMATV
jgi:hypothetical protein